MSWLKAVVADIKSNGSLHIVDFWCSNQKLSMMSLELNKDIKINSKVILLLKPTQINIAKKLESHISCSNIFKAVITSIQTEKLLSNIKLKFHSSTLESIITTQKKEELNLKKGDEVFVFFNASALSIGKIINE